MHGSGKVDSKQNVGWQFCVWIGILFAFALPGTYARHIANERDEAFAGDRSTNEAPRRAGDGAAPRSSRDALRSRGARLGLYRGRRL